MAAVIYEVRAEASARVHSFGARRSRAEAEVLLAESRKSVAEAGGHNDRYWIEEIDTEGLFEIPPRPTPRERYSTRVTLITSQVAWSTVDVEILDGERLAASYHRNYGMLETFEPFRQGSGDFALISPDYTATSVVDLATGNIVASEPPNAGGFCPVGFYVPDWWDIHADAERHGILPGALIWDENYEWPTGDFGFVWGCVWGDDSTWKVQYLDLSQITAGVVGRDDRFGYVELATNPKLAPQDFIQCWSFEGEAQVRFAALKTYDLASGTPTDE